MMLSRNRRIVEWVGSHGPAWTSRRTLFVYAVVALACAAAIPAAQAMQQDRSAANTQQATRLLKQTLAAMGGTAVAGASDLSLSCTMTSYTPQRNTVYEMRNQYSRPNKIRQTTQFDFGELIVGFDGSVGWVKNPEGVEELPASQREEMRSISLWILYDMLQNIGKKEYTYEYVRSRTENGSNVHELSVRHRQMKEPIRILIDDRTKLIVRKIVRRQGAEGLIDVEEILADYRTVQGVKVPFAITYQAASVKVGDLIVKEAKFNSGLSPALFQKPK
jgi:outer membrane lipoprotein-sorting protein